MGDCNTVDEMKQIELSLLSAQFFIPCLCSSCRIQNFFSTKMKIENVLIPSFHKIR